MIVSILMSAVLLTASGQEAVGPRAEGAVAGATAPLTETEMGERLANLQSRFPGIASRIRSGRPNAGHRRELWALETDLRQVKAELAAHAAAYPDSRWADFDIGPAHVAISVLDFELSVLGVPR